MLILFSQSSLIEHYSILPIVAQTTLPVYHIHGFSPCDQCPTVTIKRVFLVVRNVPDPRIALRLWQKELCEKHEELTGNKSGDHSDMYLRNGEV